MSEKMITYNINNCLKEKVGLDLGISFEQIFEQEEKFSKAISQIKLWQKSQIHGFIDLPANKKQIEEVDNALAALPEEIDTLLHIGIGGSSLGPIAIQMALDNSLTPKQETRFKEVIIQENVDPEGFAIRMDKLDLAKTAIHVVSKSGGTIETLACFSGALNRMKKVVSEDKLGERVIISTENDNGVLAGIAKKMGAHRIVLPSNVGGRFSVLTPVGLLPARAMGLDIADILKGADDMRKQCLKATQPDDPAFLHAFLSWYYFQKGIRMQVLFPYSEMLRGMALWCCQLLGESLGKKVDRNNNIIRTGQTPIPSVGSVDQHSLLQLYMEGPADKWFNFFKIEKFRSEENMNDLPHPQLDKTHLQGLKMGEILNAELAGTAQALAEEGRPSGTFIIPEISPHSIGQLFYFFELSTAYAAELFSINAFDQPGVEASKKLTIKYLREGE